MMTREDKLRELELLPVWQLRAAPMLSTMPAIVPIEVAAIVGAIIEQTIPAQELQQVSEVALGDENSFNMALTSTSVANQAMPIMRLLVSEDDNWLFLLASSMDATAHHAEAEILFQNMLRAIGVKTKLDIANTALSKLSQYSAKIIVVFGDVASQTLLGEDIDITIEPVKYFESLRLKQHAASSQPQQHALEYNALPVVVTYHPNDLLMHLSSKALAWDDLKLALRIVHSIQAE